MKKRAAKISDQSLEEGFTKGKFFKGVLRVSETDRRVAFVHVAELKTEVAIDNLYSQNYGLDGDTVAIEIYPPTRWRELARKESQETT